MLQEAVGDDRLRLCFTDVLQHDWSVGLEDVTPMAWDAGDMSGDHGVCMMMARGFVPFRRGCYWMQGSPGL
jgi:hypothetical protein